ncbi:hypothetical protein ACFRQM_26340 [Streptomyces sp. NPDC056831]|uniref:hypothetical protein n=1 Tax=Streptomyces sp. NPDC056831 TaxID=3345954 RepID=UPI003687C3EF
MLIAEDMTVVREGLVSVLTREPGIEVVARASHGDEVLATAPAARPDVAAASPRAGSDARTRHEAPQLNGTPWLTRGPHDVGQRRRAPVHRLRGGPGPFLVLCAEQPGQTVR